MKIYILRGSAGTYEDYREWDVGIYRDRGVAERLKQEFDEYELGSEEKVPLEDCEVLYPAFMSEEFQQGRPDPLARGCEEGLRYEIYERELI